MSGVGMGGSGSGGGASSSSSGMHPSHAAMMSMMAAAAMGGHAHPAAMLAAMGGMGAMPSFPGTPFGMGLGMGPAGLGAGPAGLSGGAAAAAAGLIPRGAWSMLPGAPESVVRDVVRKDVESALAPRGGVPHPSVAALAEALHARAEADGWVPLEAIVAHPRIAIKCHSAEELGRELDKSPFLLVEWTPLRRPMSVGRVRARP